MTDTTGVFTLSLDTELAWGTFDVGRLEAHKTAYRATPDIIERLCELFDEYQIPATWALVSHLLVDCRHGRGHADRTLPDFPWIDDWFAEMPCSSGLDEGLWYAPWIVDRLQACQTDQEIGLHGATHMPLGANGCSRRNAEEELEIAIKTLREHGEEPETFVYPRNDIGHVDVLRDNGIRTYREVDARWYERSLVPDTAKPPLRFLDEATQRTPPIVEPTLNDGLVELPGSQIFRPSHGGWQYAPTGSSVARAKKGLQRAAQTGGVFHLWFHPFNLGHASSKDMERFERVLAMASELAENGEIERLPMREVGIRTRQGRWG
ncbi:polysaccharide deacetylase family protein [Natrinema versiforme]|uniref:NodB homology domain-containing protein n=1 Tax=Natrinema versiforme TaxID=88724 RepID=A0A4P8WGB7_9EURY|nr:polysaccharide deacetylase family protein [Natrinema versiforme]QCS42012.1 hypothetical protein FEJ81_06445 [Natrinema versiforme]